MASICKKKKYSVLWKQNFNLILLLSLEFLIYFLQIVSWELCITDTCITILLHQNLIQVYKNVDKK